MLDAFTAIRRNLKKKWHGEEANNAAGKNLPYG